jgi:hypothetical protein
MGFKPKIPASELLKTVHAVDGTATVTGLNHISDANLTVTSS